MEAVSPRSNGAEVSNARSNGRRPPSPPPIKSTRRSRSHSRERDHRRRDFQRRNYSRSPPGRFRNRNRSRSPEYNRSNSRRSRSTSRGRRSNWSPSRRRPRTPLVPPPPAMNVPAYVPQPYDQYAVPYGTSQPYMQYNAPTGFDPTYGAVPTMTAPGYASNYLPLDGGIPPPPAMSQDPRYAQQGPNPWANPMAVPNKIQDEAVAQEMQQQKATLRKQRDDYDKRRQVLKRELKILKEQRVKLASGSREPPSPTTKNFLKENDRLQSQIENKMSTIDNVIEMLSNIIGKDEVAATNEPPPPGEEVETVPEKKKSKKRKRKKDASSDDDSEDSSDSEPEKLKTKVIESMKQRKEEKSKAKEGDAVPPEQQINYAFYDPELHWCRSCNVFPKTAKDLLTHLHSKEHADVNKKSSESPWHENNINVEMPTYAGAPTRRTPIRGLQFFVPSNAWFCKLCSIWMGDLHCASLHLKSKCHSDSFTKFVEHNPDFEVDWISERQKAYDMHQGGDNAKAGLLLGAFESIPLQLNRLGVATATAAAAVTKTGEPLLAVAAESKKSKGKKKSADKKEKRKGKKRSKATKKRNKGGSGSSSDSSSSSDSDSSSTSSSSSAEEEARRVPKKLANQSIRNTMRKMEPEVAVPPLAKHLEERDRRPIGSAVAPIEHWRRDPETEPDRRGGGGGGLGARRGGGGGRYSDDDEDDYRGQMGRRRSPGFDNRHRDVRRNKSKERQYRRRDSRSPARSPYRRRRSRTRSRSRSRSPYRRIEKAVVNYPPQFKPRVAEKLKTTTTGSDKRRSPPAKKTSSASSSAATTKKLPFIGRMPVFKKQAEESQQAEKPKEEEKEKQATEKTEETPPEANEAEGRREGGGEAEDGLVRRENNDDEELMPDPEQLRQLMDEDRERTRQKQQQEAHDEEILPPGIDESESDMIPKPINDAPVPRRGPLPKDLEDALNIIFPGEKPEGAERKPFVVTGHIKDNGTEIITGPEPEDEQAQNTAAMYHSFQVYGQQNPDLMALYGEGGGGGGGMERQQEAEQGGEEVNGAEDGGGSGDGIAVPKDSQPPVVEKTAEQMEMEELAMLGIDASDLAAHSVCN